MKQCLKRLSAIIVSTAVSIAALMPLAPVLLASAQEGGPQKEDHRIVRVAYPVQEGLTDIDEDGNYCGYTYEYLQEIAQYTGWEYEFVQTEGDLDEQLTVLMDMLQKGEVDLMGGMLYSEAMGELYNFSSQSYGTVETVLQTTYDHAGEVSIDSYNEQAFRVAVVNLEGRSIRELEDYCSMNMITPEYILCENETGQIDAIREGRADMLLNTSMNPLDEVVTIASFAPKPFYFICSQTLEGSLLNDLNASIQYITESNPFLPTNLYEKYFTLSVTDFALTDEERDYIEEAGVLKVGVVDNQPPYYKKTDDGVAAGIIVEISRLITDKSGLGLELVAAPDQETLYQMIGDGRVDLISGVPHNYENAVEREVVMSDPYLTEQCVLVLGNNTDKLQLKGKRLAMPQSTTYHGYTLGEVIYFQDMNACMKAIIEGRADYTYVDTCTAQYYANLPEYWNLQQTPVSYNPIEFCFGLARPADRRLLVILNKVISSITVEEQQVIITDNVVPERRLSLNYIVREYPIQIFCASLLILFVVLIWLWQGIKARRRFHEEEEKRNQLYEMVNDHFFEYYHESDKITMPRPFSGDDSPGMVTGSLRDNKMAEDVSSEFIKTVRSGQDGDFEVYDKCQDGKFHWLRIIQKNLRNRNHVIYCTIGKVKIIDSEKNELMEFVNKAQRDGLTGLYNASTFRAMTEKLLEEMEPGEQGALLLMDIDHFKRINDVYGHMQGDRALCWLADLLRQYFDGDTLISRYGGDEMMVLLERTEDKEQLDGICKGLCSLVRSSSSGELGNLTISLGAVLCSGTDSYDDIFLTADYALYQTKAAGRDGYYIAEEVETAMVERSGRISCKITEKWLDDTSYQAILKATRMIAFEYDVEKRVQRVSPFIGEYIAGNYDGRMLSDVMVEDGIIYPDDLEKSLSFKKEAVYGNIGETVLRLLTPKGDYRWFRMILTNHQKPDGSQMTVGVIEDIHIQMQYQELLRHRAEIDSISGIYNKDTFFEQTQKYLASEPEAVHYLLRFDIERFKLVNELFGSAEGDRVLKYVGDILRQRAAGGETYGRLGNDVFGMCTGRTREKTIDLVRDMERELTKYPLSFRFFLPTGIMEIPPGSSSQVSSLCDKAAMAQRRIKGNYLRSYSFYEPYMGRELNREYELVANMEEALNEKQFVVYYQPQFDMRDGSLIGVEALARWQHPTLGMISPNEFIPLFEKNGFIIRLDEYIWEQVCLTIRDWLESGIAPVPVSVNVSRTHLYDSGFCQKVIDLCNRYSIPHSLLELEITESAYTERPQDLFSIMDKLQQTGFIFAMDDFGSGYSSLNILKDIPVNIVKFDLRFLEKTRRGDEVGRNILRHAILLMKDLKLSILAEGVENEEQISFLLDMGCYYAQGFYYARPMPLADYDKLLKERKQ